MAGHAGFVVCGECGGGGTVTHPGASEREWLEGLREEPCATCRGSGLVATDELREKATELITGRFDIVAYAPYSPHDRHDATLTTETERRFAGPGTWSHCIDNPEPFDQPVRWWRQAPQSVWSLTEADVARIEDRAFTVQESLLVEPAVVRLVAEHLGERE